jgi:hypothetical protein
MKIAVDLDGTISEYPEFFRLFCKAMREAGCRIYVVTDRPEGTEDAVAEQQAAIEQLRVQLGGPEGRLTEGVAGEPNSGVVPEPNEQAGGEEF